jgi:hypothetical protein
MFVIHVRNLLDLSKVMLFDCPNREVERLWTSLSGSVSVGQGSGIAAGKGSAFRG